jgi:flagellar basal body-associated protein FliL
MAEPEKTTEKAKEPETPLPEKKGLIAKNMPVLIVGGVVVLFAAAGFLVSRMFGTRGQAQTAGAATSKPEASKEEGSKKEASGKQGEKGGEAWYYELDPVVANLNEPGVTRYVRITLTLEIDSTWPEEEGELLLNQKKPLLKHWLTLYLSNQTIEDARGKTNMLRMQSNIGNVFNEGLFPNAQPRITNVLFKEFAIQ